MLVAYELLTNGFIKDNKSLINGLNTSSKALIGFTALGCQVVEKDSHYHND